MFKWNQDDSLAQYIDGGISKSPGAFSFNSEVHSLQSRMVESQHLGFPNEDLPGRMSPPAYSSSQETVAVGICFIEQVGNLQKKPPQLTLMVCVTEDFNLKTS